MFIVQLCNAFLTMNQNTRKLFPDAYILLENVYYCEMHSAYLHV